MKSFRISSLLAMVLCGGLTSCDMRRGSGEVKTKHRKTVDENITAIRLAEEKRQMRRDKRKPSI